MKIIDKEYLKNQIEDIKKKLANVREQGDFESDEYCNLKMDLSEAVHNYEFMCQNPKEYAKMIKKQKQRALIAKCREKFPLNFIDNDLFVLSNKNKKFTEEECVALIIHCEDKSLNAKFEALKAIKTDNKELIENINKWIEYKKNAIEYLYSLNDPNVKFLVCFERAPISNAKLYSSFEKALENDMVQFLGISVELVDGGQIGSIANVKMLDPNILKRNENNSNIFDRVTDVTVMLGKDINVEGINAYSSPLYELGVELKHPFKPFDFVWVPAITDMYSRVVIADKKDPKVQELFANKANEHPNKRLSWAKLNIANYYLETNSYAGNGVEQGQVTQSLFHEYYGGSLKEIKLIDPLDLTLGQVNYIKDIKKQLKKRK